MTPDCLCGQGRPPRSSAPVTVQMCGSPPLDDEKAGAADHSNQGLLGVLLGLEFSMIGRPAGAGFAPETAGGAAGSGVGLEHPVGKITVAARQNVARAIRLIVFMIVFLCGGVRHGPRGRRLDPTLGEQVLTHFFLGIKRVCPKRWPTLRFSRCGRETAVGTGVALRRQVMMRPCRPSRSASRGVFVTAQRG